MEFDSVKDSGERQEFSTGARRDIQKGKGRFDLLPPRALLRLARHYENGAEKYGDNNWLKGMPLSRFLDSAGRHYNEILKGDLSEDHITAAVWNLLGILELQERIEEGLLPQELNDLPYTLAHNQKPEMKISPKGGFIPTEKSMVYGTPADPMDDEGKGEN
jgi:hypothetical protein